VGALLAIVVMVAICFQRWSVSTDITAFLADQQDAQLTDISRRITSSELTRTVILRVEGGDGNVNVTAAKELADTLESHPEVAWLRAGVDPDQEQAFHALYSPRAAYFLAPTPEQAAALLAPAGLEGALAELRHQLSLPTAPLVKQMVPQDPLLRYPALLERLQQARESGLDLRDGRFVTPEGHALIFLASKHPPFSSREQGELQAAIYDAFATINTRHGGGLQLAQSGVGRFALSAERIIRADITRISVVSTVGLVLLFLLIFRSPRLVFLIFVPLAMGVLAACSTSLLVFGQLHGLTLAVGAALIGVCIDYSIHLFNHHMLDPDPAGAFATSRRIWPGLLLGAVTTIAGFAGLAWKTFPGLREIAVFAGVGVLAAVLTTRYLVPAFLPQTPEPGRVHRACARLAERMLAPLAGVRRGLVAVPLLAIVVCAIGLPQINWVDDIKALNRLDPELLQEDENVRASVSRMDAGRFVIAIADTEDTALDANDRVAHALDRQVEAGTLAGYRSLHSFLWAPSQQRRNLEALRAPGVATNFEQAIKAAGFRPEAFAGPEQFLPLLRGEHEPPPPLTFSDLANSPLAPLVRSFRLDLGDSIAVITYVRGVANADAIKASLAGIAGVYYFDHGATMQVAYRRYRTRSIELISVGLLAVLALVLIRYRSIRPSLSAYVPACIAAATTLAVLGILGGPVHILHIVSLLLVLSMGVDYGVFLTEAATAPGNRSRETAAALLSVVFACLSTVLAFGLLGMSSYPALEAIGTTVGLGVILSFICAPVSLVLAKRK